MEVSVGFADGKEAYYEEQGYACEESALGKVYYQADQIELEETRIIRYMVYPWISHFELEGIIAKEEKE